MPQEPEGEMALGRGQGHQPDTREYRPLMLWGEVWRCSLESGPNQGLDSNFLPKTENIGTVFRMFI